MGDSFYQSAAWRAIRPIILERDGWKCQVPKLGGKPGEVCGKTEHPKESMPVDHIIPKADGGELLDPENLRASCVYCNSARAGRATARIPSQVWHAERKAETEGTPSVRTQSREWL